MVQIKKTHFLPVTFSAFLRIIWKSTGMIRNYLKIAFRNILRHKAYSAINIFGLAIGMACSILIFLWVQHELSFDRFHVNEKNIYRVAAEASGFKVAVNPAGMPSGLKAEIPVIKNFVRFSHPRTHMFELADKKFIEKKRVFLLTRHYLTFFPLSS